MSAPVGNMQQLVSHWTAMMAPKTTRKRSRDDDNQRSTKSKTQGFLPVASTVVGTPETRVSSVILSSAMPGKSA